MRTALALLVVLYTATVRADLLKDAARTASNEAERSVRFTEKILAQPCPAATSERYQEAYQEVQRLGRIVISSADTVVRRAANVRRSASPLAEWDAFSAAVADWRADIDNLVDAVNELKSTPLED